MCSGWVHLVGTIIVLSYSMRTVCDLKDPARAPAWSGGSQEPHVSPVVSLTFVIPSVGVISLSFFRGWSGFVHVGCYCACLFLYMFVL